MQELLVADVRVVPVNTKEGDDDYKDRRVVCARSVQLLALSDRWCDSEVPLQDHILVYFISLNKKILYFCNCFLIFIAITCPLIIVYFIFVI